MHFGSPYSAGFGAPQNHLRRDLVQAATLGRPHRVYLQAAPAFVDGIYGIYVNAIKATTLQVVDSSYVGPILVPPASGVQSVQILRHGHSADDDLSRVAKAQEATTSARASLSWTWPSEFLGTTTAGSALSGWAFTGVAPSLLRQDAQLGTRYSLAYGLTVAAGTATVVFYGSSGAATAKGVGPVGTTVTVVALVSGAIEATVAVSGGATDESGSLLWRWPSGMQILRGGVLQTTVYTPLTGAVFTWTEPADLAAGVYAYTLKAVSDTGVVGSASSPVNATVNAPPLPASNLHYVSGNAAAITVGWTASGTAGATYNRYVQGPTDPFLDLNAPVSLPAGTTANVLPAQSGYPGVVRVLLRAVSGGVEENRGQLIEVELDASGARVAPRPNDPAFGITTWSGANVTVNAVYVPMYETAVGTKVKLYLRTPTGSYDFTSPTAEGTLGTLIKGQKLTAITATVAPGRYYMTLRSAAADGTLSEGFPPEQELTVDTTTMTAPVFDARASRS